METTKFKIESYDARLHQAKANAMFDSQSKPELDPKERPFGKRKRDNTLMSYIGKAVMHHLAVDDQHILDYARKLNDARCRPPIPEKELRYTVYTILRISGWHRIRYWTCWRDNKFFNPIPTDTIIVQLPTEGPRQSDNDVYGGSTIINANEHKWCYADQGRTAAIDTFPRTNLAGEPWIGGMRSGEAA